VASARPLFGLATVRFGVAKEAGPLAPAALYVHAPRGRRGRAIDAATEQFVDETRTGSTL